LTLYELIRKNRDIVGGACVKDMNGKVIEEDEKVKDVWKEYIDKLLNVEFPWSRERLICYWTCESNVLGCREYHCTIGKKGNRKINSV